MFLIKMLNDSCQLKDTKLSDYFERLKDMKDHVDNCLAISNSKNLIFSSDCNSNKSFICQIGIIF
jgi:hypothetical protein